MTTKTILSCLRTLPEQSPPTGLTEQIMALLPRRRGIWGYLEQTLWPPSCRQSKPPGRLLLPSHIGELGLYAMSAGVFLACLMLTILGWLLFSGAFWHLMIVAISLAPALVATPLLFLNGWQQLKKPHMVLLNRFLILKTSGLFALSAIASLLFQLPTALMITVLWLGLSGVAIAGGLGLMLNWLTPKGRFAMPKTPVFKTPAAIRPESSRGFTLIEVIVVLILLGILTAVAVARVTDQGADERAAADKLQAHLRFAQMQALNSNRAWGIEEHGSGYRLFSYEWDPDADTYSNKETHAFPGEGDEIALGGISVANLPASFDNWGRPYNLKPPSGNSTGWKIKVGSENIEIAPETGFMP